MNLDSTLQIGDSTRSSLWAVPESHPDFLSRIWIHVHTQTDLVVLHNAMAHYIQIGGATAKNHRNWAKFGPVRGLFQREPPHQYVVAKA